MKFDKLKADKYADLEREFLFRFGFAVANDQSEPDMDLYEKGAIVLAVNQKGHYSILHTGFGWTVHGDDLDLNNYNPESNDQIAASITLQGRFRLLNDLVQRAGGISPNLFADYAYLDVEDILRELKQAVKKKELILE
nr:hypothetical protein [uncultured Nitrososphaera sp.]